MLRKSFLILLSLFSFSIIYAQEKPAPYQVKGILVDSLGEAAIGVSIKISHAQDSILTGSDLNGEFTFPAVTFPNFTLQIKGLGFEPYAAKYTHNATKSIMEIPTITLKFSSNMLAQVIVDGTPAITYKTDTAEYRANLYKVRENADVSDLLKKMDGMEVSTDGELTVQGESVTKIKVNGKEYFGGDIASALKELPADIIDKIQIVDDYGDEAARTGIKDGEPQKVINIVTREDKKIGTRGDFQAGLGSDDRYRYVIGALRFNGNQRFGLRSNFNNTVTGVGGSGGSGGYRKTNRVGFFFGDDLTEKVNLNFSYDYNTSNNNSINNSNALEYIKLDTLQNSGNVAALFSERNGSSENDSKTHQVRAKLTYDINKSNWLIITPELNLNRSSNSNNSTNLQTGAYNQDQINRSANSNKRPSYSIRTNYGHRFNEEGTLLSLQLSSSNSNNNQKRDTENRIKSYNSDGYLQSDSLLHRIIGVDNTTGNYRGSITFSQPLSEKARLQFNGQINYRTYDNSQITRVSTPDGAISVVDSLSKIFNYSFQESRYSLSYRYNTEKSKLSFGMSVVPSVLRGESQSLNNTTENKSLNFVPVFRYEYQWSKQKRLFVRYNGNANEPSYEQIQDVPDVTNPQNPVIGNPNLKASFRHQLVADYKNYIIRSKITIHGNISSSYTTNQVIRNTSLVLSPDSVYIRETRFVNANGNYNYSGRYDFSKRFADKYAISLNGNLNFTHSTSMSNNAENIGKSLNYRQKVGVQITPVEWLEIEPSANYAHTTTNFSLASVRNVENSNLSLSMQGKVYFFKTFHLRYDLSKNFVKGLDANISTNPFIINASLTQDFFKKRNASISFSVYDILNQNNFVSRRNTDSGYIDTKSNALSRYVFLRLTWKPQRWSGGSQSQSSERRSGDGSYY